jgi:hypothetical protein
MYSLLWLPSVLRAAGLLVQEVPGWESRGHGDFGTPLGVLCHHNCGSAHGDMPQGDIDVLVHGRPGLDGPLCNLGLGRSGIWRMVAAGLAWHAGVGEYPPKIPHNGGNTHLIGIEAENVGDGHDVWPDVQLDSYRRGCAAILKHIGAGPEMCIGHKEYATPKGRKDDPTFDMVEFRAGVARLMAGTPAKPPAPIVASRPPAASATAAAPAPLDPATSIAWVQQALNRWRPSLRLPIDGRLSKEDSTYTAIEAFQARHGLKIDGDPGRYTRLALRAYA